MYFLLNLKDQHPQRKRHFILAHIFVSYFCMILQSAILQMVSSLQVAQQKLGTYYLLFHMRCRSHILVV
jgi:hypothetical protein